MKILLIGSKGMLGTDCKSVLAQNYEIVAPDKKELDITSWDKVIEQLHHLSPDIIINCAGFTDMDACEKERMSFFVRKVNVEGPRNLAQGSARFDCKLIHISSGYVFSGQKNIPQPYFEDDPMDPISAYGRSKMESEIALRENAPDYIIVRSAWLFGRHGNNFMKSLLAEAFKKKRGAPLKIANDQFGSPTWTYRLALQIQELIRLEAKGSFHATSEDHCTRSEYAEYVIKKLGLKLSFEPCISKASPRKAKRPLNCILENRLLKKQGINIMPSWKEDVDVFLEKYGDELIKEAKSGKA